MKIIVDKMPENTEECIFGQNGPVFRGHRYCELSNGALYCLDPKECPYLKSLTDEINRIIPSAYPDDTFCVPAPYGSDMFQRIIDNRVKEMKEKKENE